MGHGNSILCPPVQQNVHQHTNVHVFTVLPVVVLENILPVAVLVLTVIEGRLKVKKAKVLVCLAILVLLVKQVKLLALLVRLDLMQKVKLLALFVILESIKVHQVKFLVTIAILALLVEQQVKLLALPVATVNTKSFLMVHRAKTAVPVNTLPVQRSHVKVVKVENFKRQHHLPSTLVNFVQLAKNLPQKVPRVSIV